MNFFKAQDQARKSTFRLVMLFSLAIITLILLTNIVVIVTLEYQSLPLLLESPSNFLLQLDSQTFVFVSLGVGSVILLASMLKLLQLSQGGRVVAEYLGGQAIPFNSDDPAHQKVLNVVEEMAIASGSHVPVIYLLEEQGINAFAAGWNSGDAIIGITRGAVEKLNRDELQAVIAHEFSHILNGDMRLNIQLTGVLYGIEVIGLIGKNILRIFNGGHRHSRTPSGNSGGGFAAFMVFAVALLLIGYLGMLFGNLIKASISRHREYLADASAVQFTRNPFSIANALKKIGGDSSGSLLNLNRANEYSHLYFANGIKKSWFNGFDTHPPLDERIQRLDPQWDGRYTLPPKPTPPKVDVEQQQKKQLATSIGMATAVIQSFDALDSVGKAPNEKHIGYAHQLLDELPKALHNELKDPYAVRAAIYALLLDHNADIHKKQLFHLKKHADKGVYQHLTQLTKQVSQLSPSLRLPLIDLAIPTLRELSLKQYRLFRANALVLMKADQQIDINEWILQHILFRHLDEAFNLRKRPASRHALIGAVKHPCEIMLSRLAYAEHQDEAEAQQAFIAGRKAIGAGALNIIAKDDITPKQLDEAMDQLEMLKPLLKQRFLKACAVCLTHNDTVTIEGAEILRALASGLDCPIPPIIPSTP